MLLPGQIDPLGLQGTNIVVYDCEIVNEIKGNITWNDHDKMGLSVACLYDYRTDDYSVYFDQASRELADRLNEADLVVGFNTTGFDHKLVHAVTGRLDADLMDVECERNYDMLYWSRRAMGWSPSAKFPSGMRLDNHLESTFGREFMKTGDGANAPIWWQQGLISKVTSYCLSDVKRERMLFEHIVRYGWVSTFAHGKRDIDTRLIQKAKDKANELMAVGFTDPSQIGRGTASSSQA